MQSLIIVIIQKTTQRNTEQVTENISTPPKNEITGEETTQKTTQKILSLLKDSPEITRLEFSETDGIKWHLKQLKEKSLIRCVGLDKDGDRKMVEK